MKIITADDERLALDSLTDAVKQASPLSEVFPFRSGAETLSFNKIGECDFAFLDIEMRDMNGIELAKELKTINHNINIVFVTGYSEYMKDAFEIHAEGYITKPVTKELVEKELNNMRMPVKPIESKILKVHTFGNFDVFCNGTPIDFKRSKSKELFAFLIDRKGAGVTTAQIATTLWEDKEYNRSVKNQVQNILSDLKKSLKELGADNVIVKQWNSVSVNTNLLDCDYYRFIEGDVSAINSFAGEYMSQYTWAEFTTGYITDAIGKI